MVLLLYNALRLAVPEVSRDRVWACIQPRLAVPEVSRDQVWACIQPWIPRKLWHSASGHPSASDQAHLAGRRCQHLLGIGRGRVSSLGFLGNADTAPGARATRIHASMITFTASRHSFIYVLAATKHFTNHPHAHTSCRNRMLESGLSWRLIPFPSFAQTT
jgi:hypothetical protein